jgi:hypothetical protein
MSTSLTVSRTESPVSPSDMQTKFVVIKVNPLETLLQYVLAAIDAVGCGSAIAVRGSANSDSGLQLTLPKTFMDMMVQLIQTYEGTAQAHPSAVTLTEFVPNVLYSPLLKVGQHGETTKAAIEELRIRPPDMKISVLTLDQTGNTALLVSGPAQRQADYTSQVLPVLQSIASAISS